MGWRWVLVAVAVVGSSLTLLAVEPAAATVSYADTVTGDQPVVFFRLGESSSGSSPQNDAFVDMGTPPTPTQPSDHWNHSDDVTFGVAHSGFDGDTGAAFDASSGLEVDTWPFNKASVTYEAWIKPSVLPPTGTVANLMGVGGCCLGSTVAGLRMSLTSAGTVVVQAGSDNFAQVPAIGVESDDTTGTGSWHHVVGVYDAEAHTVGVAVDGKAKSFAHLGFDGIVWNGHPTYPSSPLVIGSDANFEGSLDEIAMYDRALPLADIRTHYLASGLPPTWPPGPGPVDGVDTSILGLNAAKNWDELARCRCADPVDTGSGNLHMPIASVSVPGRGPGLDISMAYNSLMAGAPSSIGGGWATTMDMRMYDDTFHNRKIVVQETGATVAFDAGFGGYLTPDGYDADLQSASGGDWVFTRNGTERFRFDSDGRLKSISDQYGIAANTTTVTYNSNTPGTPEFRQMQRLTDGAGRSLEIAWAAFSGPVLVSSITEPAIAGQPARTATFAYDTVGNGNLTKYKDVSGGETVFTWRDDETSAGRHLMLKMRKPRHSDNGKVIENHYDDTGRVLWQEDELNRRTDFAYGTPAAGKTTVTMPPYDDSSDPTHRHKRIDTYAGGVRTQTITAAGTAAQQTTDYVFDPATNAPVTITDNAGKTTTYGHDAHGKITSVTDPTGRITRYVNDGPFDQPTSVSVGETTTSTASTVTTRNEYNSSNGRLEKTTAAYGTADAAVTDPVYGDSAHPEDMTSSVDARGKTWLFTYDTDTGQQVTATDPLTHTKRTTYNELGWPTSVTSPRGVATTGTAHDFETTWVYDIAARKTTVTGPVADPAHETGDVAVTVLDANGNTSSVKTGTGTGDTTAYTYDDADELTRVDPPGSGHKDYEYFPSGELKRYTNELGGHWDYTYDAAGHALTEADPLGRTTAYGYDAAGRLSTVLQPTAGSCTGTKVGCVTYFHDAAGRPTGIDYSDNTNIPDVVGPSGDFTKGILYDDLGRRTSQRMVTSGALTETWKWNRLSQITEHSDRNQRISKFGWDKTGNMTTIRYPGTSADVVRHFDDAGRMDSVTDYTGRTITFDHDEDANWTGSVFPGSSGTANTDTYGYDGAGRMTSATWRQGGGSGTVLGSEAYTRPDTFKGMVDTTTMTGTAGTGSKANGYDTRDRLTTAGTESFGVDDAGNLTTMANAIHQTFDAAQQLCWSSPTVTTGTCASTKPADATVYSYDAKGNRVSSQAPGENPTTLGYNQANQLVTAKVGTGEVSDGDLVAVTPTRIIDTRDGTGLCPPSACSRLVNGGSVQARIAGSGGGVIPASGAAAVLATITVVNPSATGYLRIGAAGTSAAATLNYEAGVDRSITVIAPISADLGLNTTKATDVVITVSGYFREYGTPGDTYRPLTPGRLADTRDGTGTCDSTACATTTTGATTVVSAAGAAGLPSSGASAAVVTVTVVNPAASGTVVAAPTTSTGGPGAATIGYSTGVTTNASFVAPVDSAGNISIYTSSAVDLVIDVSGYFLPPADGDLGLGLHRANPARLVSSATPTGPCVGASCATLAAGARQHVQVTGNGGIPTGAKAVIGTLTLTGTGSTAGYVQINPAGTTGTGATADQAIEFPASAIVNAPVLVPLKVDGTIDIVSSVAGGHWILDTAGYFSQPQGTWAYSYHTDGMRATKKSPGNTLTQFTWSDGGGLPLLLSQRTQTSPGATTYNETHIIYGPGGQPIEQINPDGTAVWLHHDQLGSVRLSTAATGSTPGAEVSRRTFSAYGGVAANTGSQPLLGYAGQYTDTETGYQYLRARYYDPSTGSFATLDPLVAVTSEPFGYALANPATFIDPTGLGILPMPHLPTLGDMWDGTGGKLLSDANEHKVGLMKVGAITLGVMAIPATGGTSVLLVAGAAGLTIGAEVIDNKPCKSERVKQTIAIQAVSLGVGALWAGAGQAAAEVGDIGSKSAADGIAIAHAGGDIGSNLLPSPDCAPEPEC